MQRRKFTSATLCAWLVAGPDVARAALPFGFSETDAATGVRAALERGAIAAIGQLGRVDGFLGNPKVRIPLPGVLNDAASLLRARSDAGTVSLAVRPWRSCGKGSRCRYRAMRIR